MISPVDNLALCSLESCLSLSLSLFLSLSLSLFITHQPSKLTRLNMNKLAHRYNNPWSSYQKPSLLFALQHLFDPSTPNLAGLPDLPVVHPAIFDGSQVTEPRIMWLGHASCYLQLPTTSSGCFGILFDPIFYLR